MCCGPGAGLRAPGLGLAADVHLDRGQEAEGAEEEAGEEGDQGGGGHRPPARQGAPGQVH